MKFRGEGFSTCTTGNFQSELTQFLCVHIPWYEPVRTARRLPLIGDWQQSSFGECRKEYRK
jgi:hypothetical protein